MPAFLDTAIPTCEHASITVQDGKSKVMNSIAATCTPQKLASFEKDAQELATMITNVSSWKQTSSCIRCRETIMSMLERLQKASNKLDEIYGSIRESIASHKADAEPIKKESKESCCGGESKVHRFWISSTHCHYVC